MERSLRVVLLCLWFGLLMGGFAKASDASSESESLAHAIQKVSCQDFHYFRDSCGALLKVLAHDVLSQADAVRVSGTGGALK